MSRGGYEMVQNKKLWKQIYADQKPFFHITNSTTSIKRQYEKSLLQFEKFVVQDFMAEDISFKGNHIHYKRMKNESRIKSFILKDILDIP
ncbi:hypothetical protein HZS_3498 [Henneguya salminicola]|nr:hypothetical protein HZS_3498 [Henneguya salminicola]